MIRRALFQVHLWTGLAVGLYAFAIGVTGSVLVLREEILEWTVGHSETGPVDADPMLAAVEQQFPKAFVVLRPARAHAEAYMSTGAYMMLFRPDGTVLRVHEQKDTVLQWMERFHSNFFLGRAGRLWNGIGGLLVLLMALTGIWIWWPGWMLAGRRMRVNPRAPWRVLNWELHYAIGFWACLFIVVSGITGANFTWPAQYRAAIGRFWPMTQRTPIRLQPAESRRPLTEMMAAADRALPGSLKQIHVQPDRALPFRFEKENGDVFVNPYTAEVVRTDRHSDRTAGDTVHGWLGPLHSGHFGGFGVKLIWFTFGLAMPVLFVTGFILWWNRVVMRKRGR